MGKNKQNIQQNRKQKFFRLDQWAIVVVAFAGLIVSYITVEQNGRHNRLSVLPILSFSTNVNLNSPSFDFFGWRIENRGIGPAILNAPMVILDGKPIGLLTKNFTQSIRKILKVPEGVNLLEIKETQTLPAGQVRNIFWSNGTQSSELQTYFLNLMERVDIVFCYSSIYMEQWVVLQSLGHQNDKLIYENFTKWFPTDTRMPLSKPSKIQELISIFFK